MTTPSWTTLVQAEALAQALGADDLVVVDVRFSLAAPDAGEQAYRSAHIPGARYAHLDRDLSHGDADEPGAGRHPWPRAGDFGAALGAWGVTPATQVVVYDDGDGAFAARLWFLLRAAGHLRVAVLDGGWSRWTALGLATDVDPTRPAPTRYDVAFDARRLLDAKQVQSHLDGGGLLVDARAGERFRGEVEPIDRLPGHVPGAVNRPYALDLADGCFKPPGQLAAEFAALLGSRPPDDVVAMCGSGVTACHLLLAMEHAGLPGGRLYTGSWSGWIEDSSRPVATSST